MRLACLVVPLLPLAARLRAEPELLGEAVAICAGNGPAARVVAATRAARLAGVRGGQTLAQARALVPKLLARPLDPLCERTAQEALLEVAEGFSPRLEDAAPGVVYLDIDGQERRYTTRRGRRHQGASDNAPPPTTNYAAQTAAHQGGEAHSHQLSHEQILGGDLAAAVRRAGLPAGVGIAGSKLAARVAAGLPNPPHIIPPGEEAAFLAPLPLIRIAPEMDLASTLEAWGIRTIGDLARLPTAEIHARLGNAGSDLQTAARGTDPRPLIPREPHVALHEGMTLEWPLLTLEPFLFIARTALDRLVDRLAQRGLGCERLELELRLEPDGFATRAITLPAPTREAKTLLTLIHLDLEARPPGAPVTGFSFTAHPGAPAAAQLALFGPAALSPDRLATTLARLFALLGPGRAGSPGVADAHRPEAFRLVPFLPPPPPLAPPLPPAARGLMAIRTLRPALPLEVVVDEVGEPRPRTLRTPPGETTAKRPKLDGVVRVAAGPWVLEEGWWSDTPIAREYWDVETPQAGLIRIFRDVASGEWYADGTYD